MGDYITLFFLISIACILIINIIRLINLVERLKTAIGSIDVHDSKSFEASDILKSQWISYKSTFGFGELNKTVEDAADYFNGNNLILNNSNFRFFLALPNTFVGFGILGTFIGLVVGISGFDLSSSGTIKEGITGLLAGMGTAFYTSIGGMSASIGFNLFEKNRFHSAFKKIYLLSDKLNSEFRISRTEMEIHHSKIQLQLIQDSFGFEDEEGNFVKPKSVFSTIHRELQESTRALKSFSTDLANSIEATQAIIMEEFDQSFQKAFKETLLPVIEKLDAAVEALKNEKSSTNDTLINSTIEKLESVMMEMVESFKKEIAGGAKQELENLLKTLAVSAGTLNSFSEKMDEVKLSIEEAVRNLGIVSNESMRKVKEMSEDEERRRDKANQNVEQTLARTADVIRRADEFVSGFTSEAEKLTDSIKSYQYLIDNIHNTGESLVRSSEKIAEMTQLNIDYNEKNRETNRLLINDFQAQVQQITKMNEDHLKNYELIKGSITEVFEGIDQGLNSYRTHTIQTLNDYLGEFSNKLSKASAALSVSIDELNDGLESLNDFFGKIKR